MTKPISIDQLLAFHYSQFGSARMEGEGGDGGAGGTGGSGDAGSGEKQLPQSRVNEIVATETQKAKDKALADLAKDLGVSLDDAKRIIKERKDSDAANATELDKANAARAAAEVERDKATSNTATALHQEWLDRALIGLGIPDEEDKLTRLRGLFTVEVGTSREDIKKDADKLKVDFPALFNGRTPPGSDPGRRPGGGSLSDSAFTRGMERAAKQSGGKDDPNYVAPLPIPGLPA